MQYFGLWWSSRLNWGSWHLTLMSCSPILLAFCAWHSVVWHLWKPEVPSLVEMSLQATCARTFHNRTWWLDLIVWRGKSVQEVFKTIDWIVSHYSRRLIITEMKIKLVCALLCPPKEFWLIVCSCCHLLFVPIVFYKWLTWLVPFLKYKQISHWNHSDPDQDKEENCVDCVALPQTVATKLRAHSHVECVCML